MNGTIFNVTFRGSGKRMPMEQFFDAQVAQENMKLLNYYIVDEPLTSIDLTKDITSKPEFLQFTRKRRTMLTIWPNFIRHPSYRQEELLACVVVGQETFKIVPPAYKQHIYSGVFEKYEPDVSPVNFFKENLQHFPLTTAAKMYTVELNPGDCLYIPSYWWYQSESTGTRKTRMFTQEYESSSKLAGMFIAMLEQGILDE